MITRRADRADMRLLSALVRDPNLIHLEGERPVNQGPMVMTWLLETALAARGCPTAFRVRFVSEILADDVVSCAVTEQRSSEDGIELVLEARVADRVVATALARVPASTS